MNKKTKVKLILTGVTLAATLLEGYVSSKVKTDKDKQIDKLISEVRDEMGNYSRITHNPKRIELEAHKINLDGAVSDRYVTKAELDARINDVDAEVTNLVQYVREHDTDLNNLQTDLIDLEMSVQVEDDAYSMQDYHNDMKNIEANLKDMSEQSLRLIGESLSATFYDMQEFKDFVTQVHALDKAFKAKSEQ